MPRNTPPRFILTLWPVVDRLLRAIYQIRPLRGDDSSIIRYKLRSYEGPATVLNDGSTVKTGDTIIELHLNNDWFRRRRKLNLKASQSPREFLGCFAQDLRFLAGQLNDGLFGNITALHGSTILDVAARRLGFQVYEVPDSLWKKGARFYMSGLMQVYHLRGGEALELKEKTWELREIWLSRATLMARYGPKRPSTH
jgi:peptidoglycan-N-acetylglucosamine deacetylase